MAGSTDIKLPAANPPLVEVEVGWSYKGWAVQVARVWQGRR